MILCVATKQCTIHRRRRTTFYMVSTTDNTYEPLPSSSSSARETAFSTSSTIRTAAADFDTNDEMRTTWRRLIYTQCIRQARTSTFVMNAMRLIFMNERRDASLPKPAQGRTPFIFSTLMHTRCGRGCALRVMSTHRTHKDSWRKRLLRIALLATLCTALADIGCSDSVGN